MADEVKLRSVHDVSTNRERLSDPTLRNDDLEYRNIKRGPGTVTTERRKFFYDAQIARIFIQIATKVFGGYQVSSGYQTDGKLRLKDVPVMYGSQSRVVAQLFGGASDNVVPSLPIMSFNIKGMNFLRNEIREPQATQQFVVRLRARDPDGNLMVNQPGKVIIVERLMPAPYAVEFDLHIWSSNTDQLLQLVEQLCAVFKPDLEIALSDGPLDWTSPTKIIFNGSVIFTEESPQEKPDPMQVAVLSFQTTLRLSLPVRVYDATLIHEVDVNIRELEDLAFFYFGENLEVGTMPMLDTMVVRATEQEIIDREGQ